MDNISFATAICSGGGIYLYLGQLDNGNYFLTDDDSIDYCLFLNESPYDLEKSLYPEWQDSHKVSEYSGEEALGFNKKMLKWIIDNKPDGNYAECELETRLAKLS